jgi:hypothetical protein
VLIEPAARQTGTLDGVAASNGDHRGQIVIAEHLQQFRTSRWRARREVRAPARPSGLPPAEVASSPSHRRDNSASDVARIQAQAIGRDIRQRALQISWKS